MARTARAALQVQICLGLVICLGLARPVSVAAQGDAAGEPGAAARPSARDVLAVPGRAPGAIERETLPRGSRGPGLDALLQLPSDYHAAPPPPVAGATESEWRRRFEAAHEDLVQAREALEKTKKELDQVAEGGGSSQWAMAPPGASNSGGSSTSPLSFRLRQELRRQRTRVEEAEKALRDLTIEADLAGVPADWRGES